MLYSYKSGNKKKSSNKNLNLSITSFIIIIGQNCCKENFLMKRVIKFYLILMKRNIHSFENHDACD